jgi:hypothetical protein
VTGNY